MPRVHSRKAAFDTYNRGARIPANTKSGFRRDRSKPADAEDTIFVRKGETYYEWSFRYGGTHRSTTYPKPSQLTQSEYLGAVYGLQEEIQEATADTAEDLEALRDEWVSRAREIGEEQTDKRDNMPEGLQEGDTGQLLEQRGESMEEWATELEDVDLEYDSDEPLEEWVAEKLGDLQGIEPNVE